MRLTQLSTAGRRFLATVRGRLMILILATLAPALALALWAAFAQQDEARERALRATRAGAQALAAESASSVETVQALLAGLARRADIVDDSPEMCAQELEEVLRVVPMFPNVALAAPDGSVVCSALPHPTGYVGDRPYFRQAVATGRFALSGFLVGRASGRPNVTAALPILDAGGRVRKVLIAGIWLTRFQEHLGHMMMTGAHGAFVVDRTGVVLARHPHPGAWVGKSVADVPVVRAVLERGEGTVVAAGLDGERRLYGFAPIRSPGEKAAAGYAIVGVAEATAFAETRAVARRSAIVLGIACVLILVLGVLLAKGLILDRIDRLRAATRRLAAGDLNARVGSHGRDELGRLAESFDGMAETLQRREADLVISNERFRLAAEATNEAVWEWDLVTDEGWWSSGVHTLFGWTPADVRPDVAWWQERVHPEDHEEVARGIRRVIDEGGTSWTAEYRFRRADGRYADVLDRGYVMRAADGTPIRMVGAMLDLTDRKRAEQERRVQQAALLKSEKLAALGQLAAGVAHELRNPLTVIAARAAVLQRSARGGHALTPEAVQIGAASLEEAAARMQRIVASLSMYSKPSRPEPTRLKLDELLAATKEIVAYEARTANVAVVVDIDPDASCAFGDRSQMMQILVNLAANAVQAMAEHGGTLTLRAKLQPWGGTAIEVADTGPGMPPDVLARIWDAFYTTKAEGTGLGLSIVRSLVDAHPGASIDVQSAPGEGTRFTLRMPCGYVAEEVGSVR